MEKKHLKRILIAVNTIIAVYLLIQTAALAILDKNFTFRVSDSLWYAEYTAEDITVTSEDENILEVVSVEDSEGEVLVTLKPCGAGETVIHVSAESPESVSAALNFNVTSARHVFCLNNGDFSHCRLSLLLIILAFSGIIATLLAGFVRTQKEVHYAYTSILCCGLSVWLIIVTVILLYCLLTDHHMFSVYQTLTNGDYYFILLTSPVTLLFALALSYSNIFLIRREGFTPHNMLGIILGVLMFGGLALLLMLDDAMSSSSELVYMVMQTILDLLYVSYSLLECFLLGAIVCGLQAARYEPEYDKDYIIILGCRIRDDGTLYPLIRGRADRALAFYRKQLEKTGRKAIFIPSGGKGPDEPVAEGQAMAVYLQEQGIAEEQIRVEDQSKNTRENMLFSKAIMDREKPDAKAVYSTTNFHVFRSGLIARENGFAPDGIGSSTRWYFWPNAYIREVVGMISYQWKVLLCIAAPIIAFMVMIRFVFILG